MITPLIHINGTGEAGLLEPITCAAHATTLALRAVAECAPNARDYYPLAAGSFELARSEHEARVASIAAVVDALKALRLGIIAQRRER